LAETWSKELSEKHVDDPSNVNSGKAILPRQRADQLVQSALAKFSADPGSAVAIAIASLSETGKVSSNFGTLLDRLNAGKYEDLVNRTYEALVAFTMDRTTTDIGDLAAVISVLVKPFSPPSARQQLCSFLANSASQIVIARTSADGLVKISSEEISTIYIRYALSLLPYVRQVLPENASRLEQILGDLRSFLSSDQVSDPMLSLDSVTEQIEAARKTVGSMERDFKLARIAAWLLSGRKRSERDSLKIAEFIADEISDSQVKDDLRDFVKLVSVERLVVEKDYSNAEKAVNSLKGKSSKAWALIALGACQRDNLAASRELYETATTVLQKANSTNHKTQLFLTLASLLTKNDEGKAVDILGEVATSANKAEKPPDRKTYETLYVAVSFGGLDFDSTDLAIQSDDIVVPSVLGTLSHKHWDSVISDSKRIKDLNLSLNFQFILAKSALDFTDVSPPKPL